MNGEEDLGVGELLQSLKSDEANKIDRFMLAGRMVNVIESNDINHRILISHIDYSNFTPLRGRHMLHNVILKRFCLNSDLILADLDRCKKEYLASGAMEGRLFEGLVRMVMSSFSGFVEKTRGLLK